MTKEEPKIRNAFVVDPQGNVESRDMPQHIAPLVDSLEKLRDELKKHQK